MKIIVTYTAGDGCTYSCDHYTPIIAYGSIEEAQYEFESKLEEHLEDPYPLNGGFWFGGAHFYYENFIFETGKRTGKIYAIFMPLMEELNDWFDRRFFNGTQESPGY